MNGDTTYHEQFLFKFASINICLLKGYILHFLEAPLAANRYLCRAKCVLLQSEIYFCKSCPRGYTRYRLTSLTFVKYQCTHSHTHARTFSAKKINCKITTIP